MMRELRAWAAGFYDGEGSTGCYNTGAHKYCRATVSQTDLAVLQKFHRAVGGLGRISGPQRKPNRKAIWCWNCNGGPESEAALDFLWPWLSAPKRRQAVKAFMEFAKYKRGVRTYTRRVR